MEKRQAQNLITDPCNIYKKIKVISREMEALKLENKELKPYYKALIIAETQDQDASSWKYWNWRMSFRELNP